jgi:carboxypeptidase Taq
LHVAARFEIERRLFSGKISVADLPEFWDQTYEDLLGIRADNVSEGVLQDIHWSMGAFGYFPTYTLGNLINAQLFETMGQEIHDLDAQIAQGDFHTIREWLRAKIHAQSSRYSSDQLVEKVTGSPLSADAFLAGIRKVTAEVYGISENNL